MSTNTTPTVTNTTAPTLSPKLTQAVQAFVSWNTKVEGEKQIKLKSLTDSVREEMQKKEITTKQMTQLLILAGLDATLTSKLLTLASPANEAAAEQLKAAEEHNQNQNGKRGNVIGFDQKLQIARGKKTVAEVLQAKTDGRAARPNGNAKSTVVVTPNPWNVERVKARITLLFTEAQTGGLSFEDIEEAIGTEIEAIRESAEKEQAANAEKA